MKSILLVEDSRFLRLAGQRVLTKAGYRVTSIDDGEQVLRTAKMCTPDLILLDMLLPRLGGPEVLRALKQDPATAQIPVVVLSSLPQNNETKLKADGAIAYFEKSRLNLDTNFQSLLEMVEATLAEADGARCDLAPTKGSKQC